MHNCKEILKRAETLQPTLLKLNSATFWLNMEPVDFHAPKHPDVKTQ